MKIQKIEMNFTKPFINGSSVNDQFDPNQTLDEIRQFVAQKLREKNDNSAFSMHSTFPKREYTSNDMSSTLRELSLAPSASLLVIPIKSKASKTLSSFIPSRTPSSSSSSSVATVATDIASLIFLPITIIWGIITSFFGGNGTRNTNNNGQNNGTWSDNQTRPTTNQDGNLRRRNNVRGLNDPDDDNATWNGNSTQQM